MSDAPARWVAEDGAVYYRASAIGLCDKVFVALANYYTPSAHPQWFQDVLDEGTVAEDQISALWDWASGDATIDSQREVSMEVLDGVWVVGHIDGQSELGGVLREYKKFRDSTWPRFKSVGIEIHATYTWQHAFYWHAGEFESSEFVGGHWVVDDEHPNGYVSEVYPHHLSNPPLPLIAIKKRVAYLEALINSGKQPIDVPCQVKSFPCPFFYLHDEDEEVEMEERKGDDTIQLIVEEMQQLKRDSATARKIVKAADERLKALKLGVQAWLEAADINERQDAIVTLPNGEKRKLRYTIVKKQAHQVKATEYTTVSVEEVK
jgi:hypothetical protein